MAAPLCSVRPLLGARQPRQYGDERPVAEDLGLAPQRIALVVSGGHATLRPRPEERSQSEAARFTTHADAKLSLLWMPGKHASSLSRHSG
jgi:hypothetical protein